jgi:N-acetylmuramoyl-L-alanine amidase
MSLAVCLDPGHQGEPDLGGEPVFPGSTEMKPRCSPGTRGRSTGVPEHEVNLAIALAVERSLVNAGCEVALTRRTDAVTMSNIQRCEHALRVGADVAIRIHCNGVRERLRPAGFLWRGTMTLAPSPNHVSPELWRASRLLARTVHPPVVAATGFPDRGIRERTDLSGFNWSRVPVVLLEVGYLTHPHEERALLAPDLHARLGRELAVALSERAADLRAVSRALR